MDLHLAFLRHRCLPLEHYLSGEPVPYSELVDKHFDAVRGFVSDVRQHFALQTRYPSGPKLTADDVALAENKLLELQHDLATLRWRREHGRFADDVEHDRAVARTDAHFAASKAKPPEPDYRPTSSRLTLPAIGYADDGALLAFLGAAEERDRPPVRVVEDPNAEPPPGPLPCPPSWPETDAMVLHGAIAGLIERLFVVMRKPEQSVATALGQAARRHAEVFRRMAKRELGSGEPPRYDNPPEVLYAVLAALGRAIREAPGWHCRDGDSPPDWRHALAMADAVVADATRAEVEADVPLPAPRPISTAHPKPKPKRVEAIPLARTG